MTKTESIKIEEVLKKLEQTRNNLEERNKFNLGLFYGLFFSLLANMWIVLIFDLLINKYNNCWKVIITILISIIIGFFIWVMSNESLKVEKLQREIETQIIIGNKLVKNRRKSKL